MAPMNPGPTHEQAVIPHAVVESSASIAVDAASLTPLPSLGPRLGFRPDELASLLGVSKDLVDSWIDSGAVPRARVPGKVRVIPAWWVAQALGDPAEDTPSPAARPPAPDRTNTTARPTPAAPRLRALPSPAAPARKARTREQKHPGPTAWAVPPTAVR